MADDKSVWYVKSVENAPEFGLGKERWLYKVIQLTPGEAEELKKRQNDLRHTPPRDEKAGVVFNELLSVVRGKKEQVFTINKFADEMLPFREGEFVSNKKMMPYLYPHEQREPAGKAWVR